MSRRLVNNICGAASGFLIVSFVGYWVYGGFLGIKPTLVPMLSVLMAFLLLTVYQVQVSWHYDRSMWRVPVPFRWVMAVWFASTLYLVFWAITVRYVYPGWETYNMRLIAWYQLALTSIWFIRRFLLLNRDGPLVDRDATEP